MANEFIVIFDHLVDFISSHPAMNAAITILFWVFIVYMVLYFSLKIISIILGIIIGMTCKKDVGEFVTANKRWKL